MKTKSNDMKKCPYCSEEIQSEAIKCKHCGEWLEKKSTANTLFNKTTDFIKKKAEERQQKRNSHLYIPTKENPLIIKGLEVYPDKMIHDSEVIYFHDILNIFYFESISRMNGIKTDSTLSFKLTLNDKVNQEQKTITVVGNMFEQSAILKENSDRKTKEQIRLFFNFLSKVTTKNRLYYYLNSIKEKGYFEYPNDLKVYDNGDVYKKDKFRDNIRKAYEEERLSCGSSFKGLRASSEDPFDFTLYKNTGGKVAFFGIALASKTNIHTTTDNDIFNMLVVNLFKNGSFLSENPI